MTARPSPFLVGVALRDPGTRPDPARWRELARAAEDAGADFVTVEDGPADAVLIAARLAAQTERIGIVPVARPTVTEPFHVSTSLATVDQVSGGRGGWLAEVVPAAEAQPRVTWTVPADVHADAAEHVAAVRALWDSWEDGAEIRDTATDRFLDAAKVHHVDLRGKHLSVRGPSITPRPPQGQLPVLVRVRGAADLALAEAVADAVLTSEATAPPAAPGLRCLLELPLQDRLGAHVEAAREAGFDGALVHADDPVGAVAALDAVLAERRPARPAPARTLRELLGLAPATNRFEAAR